MTAIRAADLDGDGVLDLIALTEGAALSIAMGKGEGDFHAAAVHRVCGYAAVASAEGIILRSTLPVARFGVQDLSGDDRADAYRQGVEIIHRQLLDLLRKHQVTPMEVVGADFDPHVHQAVAHEPSAAHRDGEVIAEMRRGYRLGERLLRPAMVRVAKGE